MKTEVILNQPGNNAEDLEETRQLVEVMKVFSMPGWEHINKIWAIQREVLISHATAVNTESGKEGWRAYQGIIRGFDKAISCIDNLKKRYEQKMKDFQEESK